MPRYIAVSPSVNPGKMISAIPVVQLSPMGVLREAYQD